MTLHYFETEIAQASLTNIEAGRRLNESMMNNLSAAVLRFVAAQEFVEYAGMQEYSSIQGNIEKGMKVQKMQKELVSIVKNEPAVHSMFILFEGADYIIASDRGVVALYDYPSLTWLRSVSQRRRGLTGVWTPRELRSATIRDIGAGLDSEYYIAVLSYVYSLNSLVTSFGATIVLNVYESQIAANLNSAGRTNNGADNSEGELFGTILMQRDGKTISHPNADNFLFQARNLPHVAEILDNGNERGYEFFTDRGIKTLYTYLKTRYNDWIYISIQSMENLSARSAEMNRQVILLTILVIFAGTIISVVISFLISKPMRRLVNVMREYKTFSNVEFKNEFDFLNAAFGQIEQREGELLQLLNEREKDEALLAVRDMLSGDLPGLDTQKQKFLRTIFPHHLFMAAVIALDNYPSYRRRSNTELRAYHRYLYLITIEALSSASLIVRGGRFNEDQIALVINISSGGGTPGEFPARQEKISSILKVLQERGEAIFGTTLTIGVSAEAPGLEGVYNCALQASHAVRMRIIAGPNRILYWQRINRERKGFFYPKNSETRILNYIDTRNLPSIYEELRSIRQEIISTENIFPDNIYFIYNQITGVTIKHLSEMNINTVRLFANRDNVYAAISGCETLDEIQAYMQGFFQDIHEYMGQDRAEDEKSVVRILRYLKDHYKEDISFEDMAEELNISYSYIRKMVRESTGKSVLDTINQMRIQEAKRLLADTNLTIAQIAGKSGYHNIQSINRYFKKYEGLSPYEYRMKK
ncbi:hypothetical protein FACS189485_03640 [Spirochaetia bacterium]|nr:hypothetical protein FACS189485_03640 [Spirochaetia bacterium]